MLIPHVSPRGGSSERCSLGYRYSTRSRIGWHGDRSVCHFSARSPSSSIPCGPVRSREVIAYKWIFGGDLTINLAYLVDPLSCIMLLVVTGVGFLIHSIRSATCTGRKDSPASSPI